MLAILAPVLVFGLVIFVHELGHFIAAKAVGVYAPRFSIGFGPPIFSFRRGETEYVLAWLPLGGYVRMASRHDAEAAFLEGGSEEESARAATDPGYDPNAMIPFGPKPVPENRWFESKPLWARIVIMLAGVTMNTLLAIVVATVLFLQPRAAHRPHDSGRQGLSGGGAPELAQLQPGDTIRAVNGKRSPPGTIFRIADPRPASITWRSRRSAATSSFRYRRPTGARTDEIAAVHLFLAAGDRLDRCRAIRRPRLVFSAAIRS